MALIKISNNGEDLSEVGKYINSATALLIISGILLSVFIAFTVGAIVQFLSRLLYSFQFDKKRNYIGWWKRNKNESTDKSR